MAEALSRPSVLRFSIFELDLRGRTLQRDGLSVRLAPQPLKLLSLLAAHPGELVTRERIRQELWGSDTFVDFEAGLNFCIRQVRRALRDSASCPRFIQTLPRHGYRFIAPTEVIRHDTCGAETAVASVTTSTLPAALPSASVTSMSSSFSTYRRRIWPAIALWLVALAAVTLTACPTLGL